MGAPLRAGLSACINSYWASHMAQQESPPAIDHGFDPWGGKSPGEGNSSPLQCSCLENPMDRGPWRATVYGVAQNWTQLND